MNYRPDIEEIMFILGDVLKLKVLSGAENFAAFDWDELSDALRKKTDMAEELLAPLGKADLKKPRLENGLLRLPSEFREVWKRAAESGLFKTFAPLKRGGENLPLSLSLPVWEVAGTISPAFHCCMTSTLSIAELIERNGSEEQKELFAAGLFDGSWSGAFAVSESYSDFGWDNIQTEAFQKKDHYVIRGEKTMTAGGGHDLTDNMVYLLLARLKRSEEEEGIPALFLVPARRMENQSPIDNIRVSGFRQTSDPNEVPFVSLSCGLEEECRGYLLSGTEGMEGVLQAFRTMHLGAALQAASGIRKMFESTMTFAERKPDALKGGSLLSEHPRTADAVMYMKGLSEGIRTAVYSACFLADCGSCVQGKESFFNDAAELYSLVLKVYAPESGLEIMSKGLRSLGAGLGAEFLEAKGRDDLNAGIFIGIFNGEAAEKLLEHTLGVDGGRKFRSLLERLEMPADQRPLSPDLTEAMNVWKDYLGSLIILVGDLKKIRENGTLDIFQMFADKVLKLFAEVIVCHYLILQGLESEAKLKEAGINFYNLRLETRRRPDLAKWYNKIIAAEYFALNVLSLRESDIRAARRASDAALKALW